jgi:hypothetical protein
MGGLFMGGLKGEDMIGWIGARGCVGFLAFSLFIRGKRQKTTGD